MSSPMRPQEVDGEIVVAAGTGLVTLSLPTHNGCSIKLVCVQPQGTAIGATYDIAVSDFSSRGTYGVTGQVGEVAKACEIPARKQATVTLKNANKDGTYKIRLWTEFGS